MTEDYRKGVEDAIKVLFERSARLKARALDVKLSAAEISKLIQSPSS